FIQVFRREVDCVLANPSARCRWDGSAFRDCQRRAALRVQSCGADSVRYLRQSGSRSCGVSGYARRRADQADGILERQLAPVLAPHRARLCELSDIAWIPADRAGLASQHDMVRGVTGLYRRAARAPTEPADAPAICPPPT